MAEQNGDAAGRDLLLFRYYISCDVTTDACVQVGQLEGGKRLVSLAAALDKPDLRYSGFVAQACPDLLVTVQLFGDGQPLALPISTSYKPFSTTCAWNEWLRLSVTYHDLPRSAQLAVTLYDIVGPGKTVPIGGSTVSLFDEYGVLREGHYRLYLWPGVEGDGSQPTKTPCAREAPKTAARLLEIRRKADAKELQRLDWIDEIVARKVEEATRQDMDKSDDMFLTITFPRFEERVIYHENPTAIQELTTVAPTELVPVPDPEMARDNLVEQKHRRLTRSGRRGHLDRDLKPNAKMRDELTKIVRYPPTQELSEHERDTLWRFRFYLARDRKALTKFLKCVDWQNADEAKQAVDLLGEWAATDVDDALELLSAQFTNPSVRSYAVDCLEKADDEDLLLYLLQLVQALRYEYRSIHVNGAGGRQTKMEQMLSVSQAPLAKFLVRRALGNTELCSFLFWYCKVEQEDDTFRDMYKKIVADLFEALGSAPQHLASYQGLLDQTELVQRLIAVSDELRQQKISRPQKIEKLKELFREPDNHWLKFPRTTPLPLDPKVRIVGVDPERAGMFKSALVPLRIPFVTSEGQAIFMTMFKSGDDLRQDQLILQLFSLMDRLLKKENMDLKLTPYRTLATSSTHGLVELIQAKNVAAVLEEDRDLATFLAGGTGRPVPADRMDTYVKSCAGYCVITYLLGVGDRHLDNLLLCEDGHLFHIDFGYILGRDPKPLPPPFKLCKEMVEAMGGMSSPEYRRFVGYCYDAFLILRRNANLILNLFALMLDANIPDIAIEPARAVLKVQDKFRLDLSEEAAIQYFEQLLKDSVNALFPQLVETIHKWAQYWRK